MKKINLLIVTIVLFVFSSCSAAKRASKTTKSQEAKKEIVESDIIKEVEATENVIEEETTPEVIVDNKENEVEIEIEVEKTVEEEKITIKTITPIELFDHTTWNDLIHQNVAENGDVNYKGFKNNWSVLRNYISTLSKQLPEDSWGKEEKLAYWMNAYNAMTIDLILRNYPIASIKDIKEPWDQRLWKLGTKWYNLNEIEHQILRKMGDARIHFGINCASFSCPPLLNEAFTATKVDKQLDLLAVRFINDSKRNIITPNKVQVSKIFSWFSKDFKQDGNLISFLNKYSKTPISEKARKSYIDYNWNLNEQ